MSWIKRESYNENSDGEKNYPFARWMSWLFLAASIILLVYTYYRAEISYQGNMGVRYFKYYLISLAGVLFWGVVLRLREGIRANIVMVTISLVVGLYLVEGGLILLGLGQPPAVAAAELGVEYDKRSKLKVVEDLIADGIDAVPTVQPSSLVSVIGVNESDVGDLLPLAGVSNKTTVFSNESGKYLIYESDRYGFHNPDSEWNSREVDWLLTGDSFTHGAAVQPGQEIAGQLRSITDNSVISLGMGGNGPLIEYAALIEYGKTLKPAKVLWIYYEGNDLRSDLKRDKDNSLLMQYMADGFSQNLINRQKEVDSRLGGFIRSVQAQAQTQAQTQTQTQTRLSKTRWIRLLSIRTVIGVDVDVDFGGDDVDVSPLFAEILTKAKAEVDGWKGRLYFVYLPEYVRYKKSVSHDDFRRKSEVIEMVKGLGIPVVDIHQEVFAKHNDPLALFPFRLNGHYNAEGYSEVAKAIVDGVKKHKHENNK